MTEQTDKRTERLKAALRENLRRRKLQVRGRSEAPEEVLEEVRPGAQGARAGVRDGDPAEPPEDDPA
ncbi:hypothetical protein ASF28_08350 [Methylobacterium sp. Leaf99]|uniref:hypothetical protein n=1 Tax=Methylobacterium sp. Leaf99 TaxID=1736251 RepID=UPI0006F88459|nr:hypothetical protein [Methylobacterium sp. Leaf99]KQP11058.1 hypothetical protein ASF28_08350 [Methylobacterium sp. Leaf99]